MIEETISKIEARIRRTEARTPEELRDRQELESLLAQLRSEARNLEVTPGTEETRDNDDARGALEQLQASVTGFEATHPQIVGIVNRISTILANMGF
jgi:hypothetical protein